MRYIAIIAAACALSQAALAQAPDCKAITDSAARLACYDKGTPPVATKPVARPAPASKVDMGKYVDVISAEDALMNARLKNICKGC